MNVNTSIRTDKKEPLIPQQTAPLCSKDNVDIDTNVINAATEILPDDTPSATQPMASVNTTNILPTTIAFLTTPNTPNLNNCAQNKTPKIVSERPQTIIAYVYNLSPFKRNKRNTIDYSTLALRTDATKIQSALCYSKSKRKILEEKETTRSPIKITRYTTSTDKTKLVINDRTIITAPNDLEYNFQYSEADVKAITPLVNLSNDDFFLEDYITLTVCAKVVKIYPSKTVPNQQGRTNTVAEVFILDETKTMQLDLWNEQITQVQENHAYRFINLSTSYWNNVKKLTATINTVIKETFDLNLSLLQSAETIPNKVNNEHVIHVSSIHTIEDVQKYKTCCNCSKRIVQIQEKVVKCDHCSHMMRASRCPTKLYANVIVLIEGQKKSLTIFEECLKTLLGQFDHETIDTADIVQKLLLSENLNITYNERNIITKVQAE